MDVRSSDATLQGATEEGIGPMEYTATAHFATNIDVDDVIEMFAPYHGAIADSRDGYCAVYTVEAATLSDALTEAMTIASRAGTVYALGAESTDFTDDQLKHGQLPPLVSVTEAAEWLDISRQAVNERLQAGTLPGSKVGNTWVIPLYAVLANLDD